MKLRHPMLTGAGKPHFLRITSSHLMRIQVLLQFVWLSITTASLPALWFGTYIFDNANCSGLPISGTVRPFSHVPNPEAECSKGYPCSNVTESSGWTWTSKCGSPTPRGLSALPANVSGGMILLLLYDDAQCKIQDVGMRITFVLEGACVPVEWSKEKIVEDMFFRYSCEGPGPFGVGGIALKSFFRDRLCTQPVSNNISIAFAPDKCVFQIDSERNRTMYVQGTCAQTYPVSATSRRPLLGLIVWMLIMM
jgi:hypothetical protein